MRLSRLLYCLTTFFLFLSTSKATECPEVANVDFGPCMMIIGWGWNGNDCVQLSGCGTTDSAGNDYSDYLFGSYDTCMNTCPCIEGYVECFVDPCEVTDCPAYPNAVCEADYCGGCNANFYVGEALVNCNESIFGCTDSGAVNYNSDAIYNDGSCEYDCAEPNPAGCFQTGCTFGEQCIDFGNFNVPGFCVPSGCFCDGNYGWGCTADCNGGTCIPLDPVPGDICVQFEGNPGILDCDGTCVDIEIIEQWVGDGYCDGDTWGTNLNCPAFECDGGDCGDELINGVCEEAYNEDCLEEFEGSGDITYDMQTNILDIVVAVNIAISGIPATDEELCVLDLNFDNVINVLDIILIIDIILNPTNTSFIINSGTSYGECWGYCLYELDQNGLDAHYEVYGWGEDPDYPPLIIDDTITINQWNAILNSFDFEAFSQLQDVYGCPDCADGGAEWIEISHEGITKRVTFEAYDSIPNHDELVILLRELRDYYFELVNPWGE